MKPLRLILAGAGAFGREHLTRLLAREDVAVAGVADPDDRTRTNIAKLHPGLRVASDPLVLIDQAKPDGVIVASSASSHFGIAAHSVVRGIPVLLEKPVTRSVDHGLQLAALAEKNGTFILPGHVLRFSKDHQALAEIVKSGVIGNVVYLNSRRYRDDDHAIRFVHDDPVLTTLVHDIDLAVWLAGAPFTFVRGNRSAGRGFRSLTTADLDADSGVRCHIRTSWAFPSGDLPPDRLEVVGDLGSIELDVGIGMTLFANGQSRDMPLVIGDDHLMNEHNYFFSLIRSKSRPAVVTISDAVHGLRIADKILQSLKERREIRYV